MTNYYVEELQIKIILFKMSTEHSYDSLLLGDKPIISFNDRTGLRKEIIEYWVGNSNSVIGLQYVDLKDGIIHVKQFPFERTDIFVIQFWDRCNIFLEANGRYSIDLWHKNRPLRETEREYIKTLCDELLILEREYVNRQRAFFETQPWRRLEGLTPEEAVAELELMGW